MSVGSLRISDRWACIPYIKQTGICVTMIAMTGEVAGTGNGSQFRYQRFRLKDIPHPRPPWWLRPLRLVSNATYAELLFPR